MMKYQCFSRIKLILVSLFVMFIFTQQPYAQESDACYIQKPEGDYRCPKDGNAGGSANLFPNPSELGGNIFGAGSPLVSGLGGSLGGLEALLAGLFDCLPDSMQNSMLKELTGLIGEEPPTSSAIKGIADKYKEICDMINGLKGMVCGALGNAIPDFSSYGLDSIAADMSVLGASFDVNNLASSMCGGAGSGPGECSQDGPTLSGITGKGGERIANVARAMEGYSTACVKDTDNGSLACAWVVSTILKEAGYGLSGGTTLATGTLRQWLKDDPCYKEVDTGSLTAEDAVNLEPGDILVTPTNLDMSGASGACKSSYPGRCNSGHTGIYVGNGGIVSNGSKGFEGPAAGVSENYTVDSWASVTDRNTAESAVYRRDPDKPECM